MTKDQKSLLENVLDALDRLFDRETTVIDVHALFFATSKALSGSEFGSRIEPFVGKLDEILRKHHTEEKCREDALIATDDLRHFLSDVLPFPE